ncbi:MAG: Ig-like domain-containing protein, partial [Nitrososphaerales archaeon]
MSLTGGPAAAQGNQPSTTTVLVSPNPVLVPGEVVTFGVVVSGLGASPPTGTVTFTIGNVSPVTTLCAATLSGGTGSCTSNAVLPIGNDVITGTYSGDSTYATSSGSTTLTATYPPPFPTTTVSVSPTTTYHGAGVIYSATVSGDLGSTPTGSVFFTTGSTVLCTAILGASSLTASSGTCTATNAPVGEDTVVGTYSGDDNNAGSSGTTTLTIIPPPPPPSCNSASQAISQSHSTPHVSAANLGFTPLSSPIRIADTRTGATDPGIYAGDKLCSGGQLTIDMPVSVPSNAGAVVAELTAISPSAPGFLSAFAAGTTRPGTANVSFTSAQTVGNLVTVGLGTDPSTGLPALTIYNGSGTGAFTDFTLDLYGYYAPASMASGDAFVPVTPVRI